MDYVLSFAHKLPHVHSHNVVLVEKRKPAWQAGRLNLPGGMIESGELPEQAACRELLEETSLIASLPDTRILGRLSDGLSTIFVAWCPYHDRHVGKTQTATTQTAEKVIVMDWREVMHDSRLLPNLRILIPLCQARLSNWVMETGDNHVGRRWVMDV